MGGSEQAVRDKIKRSLLIEQVLKVEVEDKALVTLAEARAYYDKNPAKFQHRRPLPFRQSPFCLPKSRTPPEKGRLKRANEALKQAKATKSYQDFGLLAEKISEDDFRVNMGDHKAVEKDKLPPQVVKALLAMKIRTGERPDPG